MRKTLLIRLFTSLSIALLALAAMPVKPAYAAACTFTSNGSGNWDTAATWTVGAQVGCSSYPGQTSAYDSVIIADGHTVSLNISPAQFIGTLTVGQGTSGILNYTTNTSQTLKVLDVVINPNGVFQVPTTSNTFHRLEIEGNFTNNGTFNGNADADSKLDVYFGGSANQTLSGTGAINSFNTIIVTKFGGSVVDVTASNFTTPAGFLIINLGVFQLSTGATITPNIGLFQINDPLKGFIINHPNAIVNFGDNSVELSAGVFKLLNGTFNMGNGNDQFLNSGGEAVFSGGIGNINGRFIISGGTTTINGATLKLDPQGTNNLGGTFPIFAAAGAANTTFTSGSVVIIDPHAVANTGNAVQIVSGAGTKNFAGSTIQFGDGVSTTAGSADGFDLNCGSGISLGNIIVNNTATNLATRFVRLITNNCIVGGNFTITNGEFRVNARDLSVAGNFTNNGTFTAGAAGTVTMNGASAQTLGGTSSTTFYNFAINNANGVTLGNHITVNNLLTFTNGRITTGSNVVTLPTTATATGNNSSYVNGNVRRAFTNVVNNFTFPVGDATNFAPVQLQFTGITTGGDVTASVTNAACGAPNIIQTSNVNHCWTLANSGVVFSTYNTTFTFQGVGVDADAGSNTGTYIVGRNSGGWTYPTFGTRTATSTQATGINALGASDTFEVGNSNTAPTGGNGTVTTNEDTTYTFTVADFTTSTTPLYADAESNPFTGIRVSSLETAGTLQCGGVDVPLNGTCADVTTLTFAPATNANGSPYATFNFEVYDGSLYSASSYTMTVNVTAVNDAPSFGVSGLIPAVNEDAGAVSVPGWIVLFNRGGGSDETSQTVLNWIVSNSTCGSLLSAGPTVAGNTLSYTTAANANGTCTFDLQVQDSGGTTNGGDDTSPASNYTITVNAVNDAPTETVAANQFRTDATTVIPQGGLTNETSVVFKATATDLEGEQYQLEVEVLDDAVAFFTDTATCTSPLTNSGSEASTGSCGSFTAGPYKWQYRFVDSGGNGSGWTVFSGSDPDFTIDDFSPIVVNISSSNANGIYRTGDVISIEVTFNEPVTIVSGTPQLTLETGTTNRDAIYTSGNGTATLTFTYTVQAGDASLDLDYVNLGSLSGNFIDAANNTATLTLFVPGSVGSLGANKAIVIDATAPDTTITGNPTNPSNSSNGVFTFTGSDTGGSGVASFECDIDGGGFSACTSPRSYTGLSDGSHTFQVRAIDSAGNVDPTPASYTWTVDTIPPAAPVVTTPANGSVTNDSTPSISGTAEPGSTVNVNIDGSSVGTTSADASGNWSFTPVLALSDGSHTVRATASDPTGNTSVNSNTNTFTVDTTAPDTTIVSSPNNPSNDNTPEFTFSSPDPTVTFQCSIDGSAFTPCVSPNVLAALADGSHTFQVSAIDSAGNVDPTPASYTWTIDATPPDTTIDSSPSNPSSNPTPTFTFSSPDPTATFECSIDGGPFTPCVSPNILAALADGSHTFEVHAVDTLGNTDPTPATYTWNIDTGTSTVTNVTSPNADGTYFAGDTITIEITFNEAVTVTGTPQLLLELGTVDGLANYVSGSGTNTLTFTYTIVTGDNTLDLDYVANTSLTLNGGSIQDAALNNANLTLPNPGAAGSLGANKDIVIDALILVVTNNGVGSVPDTGDGSISENELVASTLNISQLVVRFNKDVYNPPGNTDPDDVTNPANYILVRSNTVPAGNFNTLSCASGVVAPDIQTLVTSVAYSNGSGSGPYEATLTLSAPITTSGYYRLYICGTTSIVQANNTTLALVGNNNTAGTDFIRNFQITTPPTNGGGGGTTDEDNTPSLTVAALPATGFAPNRVTVLPEQPADLAYSNLGDLWIEIPSLGIKTSIVGVPQTAIGEWDVTWLANNVGWLNGTAYPSWEGNSVLTAHITNADGLNGPFTDLKKLKFGDQIIIHMTGERYIFEVRASRLTRPFATNYAFEDLEDQSYLTLITCQVYNPLSETYMFRRVVRAVLVEVKNE